MKRLQTLMTLPLVAILFFAGCGTMKNAVKVGSDISLGTPIKSYSTFTWVKDIDEIPRDQVINTPTGVLLFNNETVRSKIKNNIKYELTARGFKLTENDPDMVVNFVVFEHQVDLRTYNGYQVYMGDSSRTKENVEMVSLKPGTLYITLLSNHGEGVLWQGYASGIFTPETVKEDKKLKSAVARIFSQFNFRAFQK